MCDNGIKVGGLIILFAPLVVELTILTVLIETSAFFFALFLIAVPKKHECHVFTGSHKLGSIFIIR